MTRLYCTSLDNRWAAGIHEGEHLVLTRAEPCQRWEIWDGAEDKEDAIQRFLGAVGGAAPYKTLKYDDKFRIETKGTKWAGRYNLPIDAYLFTLAGYAAKNNDSQAEVDRWIAQGGNAVDSISRGAMICDNRELMRRLNAEWDAAPVLQEGEIVGVDGKLYTVKVRGLYSNPVAFVEVK